MKKYLQLAAQILRYGTLRGRGQNFQKNRAQALESLSPYVPPNKLALTESRESNSPSNLAAQLAFIRSAFRKRGGHLTASEIAYIRIPKSANTSISYALLVKKYPALKTQRVNDTQINFLADVNLNPVNEADTEQFFTVVRDPFIRLVSVYRDFFENRQPDFLYAGYLFGVLKPDMSFATFVSRVSEIPDRLKDQHFRPQHCFIDAYETTGKSVTIFKLEEPAELEQFLQTHEMELPHLNKSTASYSYADYYTPAVLDRVYSMYKTDIMRYGYQANYEKLKASLKP